MTLEERAAEVLMRRAAIADEIAEIRATIGRCDEEGPGSSDPQSPWYGPSTPRCCGYDQERYDEIDPEECCESCARRVRSWPRLRELYGQRSRVLAETLQVGRRLCKPKEVIDG